MYVKVTNGIPTEYTIGELRRDNPNTSFPKIISDSILASYDVYPVVVASRPTYDNRTQYISLSDTPELVDGSWTLSYSVVDRTADEITKIDDFEGDGIRAKRDELLAETDYLALSDNTLTTEMTAYRQALRDITTHANFPYLEEADWPTKP